MRQLIAALSLLVVAGIVVIATTIGCSGSSSPAVTSPATDQRQDKPDDDQPQRTTEVPPITATTPVAESDQVAESIASDESEKPPPSTSSKPVVSSAGDGLTEWPRFLGPEANGHSSETGLAATFPDDGPEVLWRAELGTGYSGLSVAGGKVFTLYGREGREYVACFDALTGEPLWKIDSDEDFKEGRSPGPRSTPTVDGERVFVLGASGQLHRLNAANGEAIWKYNIVEKFGIRLHEEGLSASPLVDGKQLIVAFGRSVYSLDKATGELLWKALDEPMNHSSPAIRILDGQRQIVQLTGRNLVGLSLAGEELWRHPQEGVNIAMPVVGPENRIFSGAAYGFGCQLIQISGGEAKEVYKNSVLSPHTCTPVLHEGHLYGFDDRAGIFKCVEFATGEEKWTSRASVKGNLILAEGKLIIFNEAGQLLIGAASPEGFEPLVKTRLLRDGLCYTAPSLANGRLYVRSDKELLCLRLTSKE